MSEIVEKANSVFLNFLVEKRKQFINDEPVILILSQDRLSLFRKGKLDVEKDLDLKLYHELKGVVHFLLYMMLANKSANVELIDYVSQQSIYYKDVNLSALLCKMLKGDTKLTLTTISPFLKYCAEMYENELHKAVQLLKEGVPYNEWNTIKVGVSGPASSRPGHCAMQYFERLTQKDERKVYYVENVYEPLRILDIIAQQELERNHFDSIVPMKTDILAFDACRFLEQVCCKK